MDIQKKYNAIDVMKLFMAFLVVGIHVGSSFETNYPVNVTFLLEMAVPFFFVSSGFFIQSKIENTMNCLCVLRRSCIRYLKLYLLWNIVYFPLTIRFVLYNNHNIADNLLYCLRRFLFVGEYFYTWPLWYLHGLIVSIIFVYLLYRCRLLLIHIWIISLMMMLIGYIINNTITNNSDNSMKEVCHYLVYILGSAERNGPFRGFALVCTGMMIQRYSMRIRYEFVLGVLSIAISYLLFYYTLPFNLLFCGFGVFVLTLSIKLIDKPCYLSLRTYSTFIYFIHMYFVVFAHMLLKDKISSVFHVYLIWTVVFYVTWFVSIIINKLRANEKFIWINNFI